MIDKVVFQFKRFYNNCSGIKSKFYAKSKCANSSKFYEVLAPFDFLF